MPGIASDCDDLPVIVNAQSLKQFPSSSRGQEPVQVVKAVVAVKESVKVFVAFGQRATNNLASVVNGTSHAERTSESSQHAAGSAFLPKSLDSARLLVQRHAYKLGDVIQRQHVVPVVVERPEVDNLEPL